jgi:hypothetical protein
MSSPALYVLIYKQIYNYGGVIHVRGMYLRGLCKLPEFVIKPFKHGNAIFDVLLRFLPHIKDRTIPARAQDVLEVSSGHQSSDDPWHQLIDSFSPDGAILGTVDIASRAWRILPVFLMLWPPAVREFLGKRRK